MTSLNDRTRSHSTAAVHLGKLSLGLVALSAASAFGAAPVLTHEDDPKILDRRPAFPGTGYRRIVERGGSGTANRELGTDALGFSAQGFRLESWLTLEDLGDDGSGNDCWGYVSPSGREYALMGTSTATVVVEVTDPANATVIERIDGPVSLWRDIKTYQDRAYSVSEGGSGIQVIDLSNVDAGVVTLENTVTGQGTDATHNVAIDEVSGFLYRTGGGGNGLRIYSLANPSSPQFSGQYQSRYVHDAQIVTYTSGPYAGRQIAFCCAGFNNGSGDTGLTILDVTNKNNIFTRAQIAYPDRAYSHQGWLSADRTRFYLGDELDQGNGVTVTRTRVFDVEDLNNATFIGSFDNEVQAVSHNMYERDGYLFQANYTSGVRVFDIDANSDSPEEVAFFDTAPDLNSQSFNGLWSCFPNLPSGTVLGSDRERGLFVLSFQPLAVDVPTAQLEALDAAGEALTAQVTEFDAGTFDSASVRLVIDSGSGPMEFPMTPTGVAGEYAGAFPPLACGSTVAWYVSALSTDGVEATYPKGAPLEPNVSYVGDTAAVAFYDSMQSDQGWVGGQPGDTADRGQWVREVPIGTDAEPTGGFPAGGRVCWFTGQGTLTNNTDGDVDFGFTTLLSPVIDMSQMTLPTVEYRRWFSNNIGVNPPNDAFVVEISNDAGANWTLLEQVGPLGPGTSRGWIRVSSLVPEFLPPTSQMQLRFIASDTGLHNIVEAGIDEFRVIDATCDDPSGALYCTPAANSTGSPSTIVQEGTAFLAVNDLELVARDLPTSQAGFFIVSSAQAFVANAGGSQGNLCVGANTGRYLSQVGNSGATGEIRLVVDATAVPQPAGTQATLPGDTWNFQCWHRDQNPGQTSNFTPGYSVTFR
jgi:choice-of-anchor B domain-containing protein